MKKNIKIIGALLTILVMLIAFSEEARTFISELLGFKNNGNIVYYNGHDPISENELRKARGIIIVNINSLDFLKGLDDLQSVSLLSGEYNGCFEVLGELPRIEQISLYGMEMSGDIGVLTNLNDLLAVNISGGNIVTGNIGALSTLSKMWVMDFQNTSVEGNISSLKLLNSLISVQLTNTSVEGDLANMASLSELLVISMDNTQVIGQLHSLSELENLKSIRLANTSIKGNLTDIGHLSNLEYLDLSGTDIIGDISSLAALNNLKTIKLNNTNIKGDLSTLSQLQFLKDVEIENTQVTGSWN